ncbi:DUF6320 domain-containing protein [Jeotgalicoccus meleagridis]|uniref:Zinc ribbon domain-containing protein n=1 Tax=Jeotgalicoccus meleagridis TaxID=2759181 RepID=A0A6V7RQ35_9STAP|nr:DUF6320 domain-containing protein [Jeotgalicoccus meleagridis]CAD2080609.1 hypothetical protein JEODO184_01975 [Jeotgalicoccus meleagridis]HIW37604.1 hypothetical protein [Candidatus Jeotgalicoccus stercoravium]
MNHCPDCEIDTRQNSCPLCHQLLSIESLPEDQRAYPRYDQKLYKMKDRLANLAILGGILATVICLLINIIVMPHFLWVFYVAVAIFYLLISLNHTILSPGHLGGKIIAQVISLTILLLVIDYMSGSLMWSINYVVPLLILAGILLMCIMILRVRMNWTSYISFLLLMIVFGFLPLILYFFGLVDVLWPAVSTASFGLAAFIAMLLIANQSFMTQLTRRFHL